MTRRALKGQAALEMSLGLVVFVVILLFGIHFAELGYLGAKVHEASASALWDSTAYRSHQFGSWYDSGRFAAPSAQASAQNRYADWDGRTSHGGGAGPRLTLTRAEPITVTCRRNLAVRYNLPPLAPNFGESGGVSCTASGDAFALRLPTHFLESGGGLSKVANNHRGASPTVMCGSGRATGGVCLSEMSVLLGEDALTDGREARECHLSGSSPSGCANAGGNDPFYRQTLNTWNQTMGLTAGWAGGGYTGAPENWADGISPGRPGGRITGFYFSFRGEGSFFSEPTNGGGSWDTSPYSAPLAPIALTAPAGGTTNTPYKWAYDNRKACSGSYCFLGKFPCD